MVDAARTYDQSASQWAERLQQGKNPAHDLLEKPAMHAMVPPLAGKRVLAIGCGSGEELALLIDRGAEPRNIVGIDVSAELLQIARRAFPDASFEMRPMEQLHEYDAEEFDYIYSSLTMHYSDDWRPILNQILRILAPGGRFLFSTHHPIKWGSLVERGLVEDRFTMGYVRPKAGMPTVSGDYLGRRRINDVWFGNMPVSYFHRPLSAIMADILASGLQILEFAEPAPVPTAKEKAPSFFSIHSRIPLFMIFNLAK